MAKKSMILKQQRPQKYSTREYNRCKICGRPHAYLRRFGICRICFRELAYKGEIPGVRKASWEDVHQADENFPSISRKAYALTADQPPPERAVARKLNLHRRIHQCKSQT